MAAQGLTWTASPISHATLADDAGCCDRTVRCATAAMRDLGLVRTGWRIEQTSNAYMLVPTLAAAGFAARSLRRTNGP